MFADLTTVEQCQKREIGYFFKEYSDGTRAYDPPTEFDDGLNDLTRQKISCFCKENPQAWLGSINARNSDNPIIEQYTGGLVYNFGADFIVPVYDETLVSMITQWRQKAEIKLLDKIQNRIKQIGGLYLHWV